MGLFCVRYLTIWYQFRKYKYIQYTSESRTQFGFRIRSYASPDHSIARPFETRTSCPRTSLDRFIKKSVIRNILFMPKRTRLVRKYPVQVSNGSRHFVFTIRNPDSNPALEWWGLAWRFYKEKCHLVVSHIFSSSQVKDFPEA
jgi:hypothetical protein